MGKVRADENGEGRRFASLEHKLSWVFLAVVVSVVVYVRWRLLAFPLERDEGEYAYSGQLLLEGIPPFRLATNLKLPGAAMIYAFFMRLFGETIGGIHLGLLISNVCTIGLIFLLARRFLRPSGAVGAAAFYACLALSESVLGIAAHANHFVVLAAVSGSLVLLKAIKTGKVGHCFWAGLLFGVAFLMKQPGIFFVAFGGVFLLYVQFFPRPASWTIIVSRLAAYCGGAVLPFALLCAWMLAAGVFGQFWFWTFSYAKAYTAIVSWSDGWVMFQRSAIPILRSAPILWLLAAVGTLGLLFSMKPKARLVFFLLFAACSILAVAPGFYFRPHYFILLLPAAALFTGLAVDWMGNWLKHGSLALRMAPLILASLGFGQSLWAARALNFQFSPLKACRWVYGTNPFPESIEIGRYLAAHTSPESSIAVLGSEPQIYFYAHRHAAASQVYTYALMEPQPFALQMQRTMIDEIERKKPAYLVYIGLASSWLALPGSHREIFDWFGRFQQEHYELDGILQFLDPETVQAAWGHAAQSTPIRSEYLLLVFKRRSSG